MDKERGVPKIQSAHQPWVIRSRILAPRLSNYRIAKCFRGPWFSMQGTAVLTQSPSRICPKWCLGSSRLECVLCKMREELLFKLAGFLMSSGKGTGQIHLMLPAQLGLPGSASFRCWQHYIGLGKWTLDFDECYTCTNHGGGSSRPHIEAPVHAMWGKLPQAGLSLWSQWCKSCFLYMAPVQVE